MGDFLSGVSSALLMMAGGAILALAVAYHFWRRGSLAKFGIPGPANPPSTPPKV